MKKSKILIATLMAACAAIPVLTGCGGEEEKPREFTFSIDIETGKNELEIGARDKIVVYSNLSDAEDKVERNYVYTSSNPSVATINEYGVILAVAEGEVNFQVKESSSNETAKLVTPIKVVKKSDPASGGKNYAALAGDDAVKTRTQILSKLEKYAMDSHLTGITLFDNGGYVKYNPRVDLPTTNYITGYGFGLLREGSMLSDMPADKETNPAYRSYYHTSIAQDSGTINAMNASGSQVSDLSSYISSAYWGTRMAENKKEYEWYPILAADKVKMPKVNDAGQVYDFETTETDNVRPIPIEKHNELGLYKKWRVYLKNNIQYRYTGKFTDGSGNSFDKRNVVLDDYEFIYKFLLTGKNGQSRGSEMAGDTTYGIKGAQKFFNATIKEENQTTIDNLWEAMKANNSLGIHTGTDINGMYIDLELVNAIDKFTAMYSLSSSLVSPIPREFMEKIGDGSIIAAGERYGNFNAGLKENYGILDYTISVGPYMLSAWERRQTIVFSRNDDWFEVAKGAYKIKGIHNRVIATDKDPEAAYMQFNSGMLDVCGIPTSKVNDEKAQENVYQTKGDSTFKLNVNSCTKDEWNELFGKGGKIVKDGSPKWDVKPWMSNNNFLNGLFYSINRQEFADKRGVQPSINYFSDAYLSNPESGESYNSTQEHKDAVAAYHTVKYAADGKTETYNDYGYNYDKAVNSFKAAVNQLTKQGSLVRGKSKDEPTVITIDIVWMYQSDPTEYGEDIKNYFETAFNDPAVSDGLVKLNVTNSTVLNWEDVYNERMMKGQFDLGFGAISGNTLNPLNFMEVLKSDNSSGFTLNWGTDTSVVDDIHPITFTDPKTGKTEKYSFDGLWEVADHGGILQNGVKVKPVVNCYQTIPHIVSDGVVTGREINDLSGIKEDGSVVDSKYSGFEVEIPLEFIETEGVELEFSRLEIYGQGIGNVVIDGATYNKTRKCVTAIVNSETCTEIDSGMFNALFNNKGIDFTKPENKWKQHPFRLDKYDELWNYEVYYNMVLAGGQPSEQYVAAKISKSAQDK